MEACRSHLRLPSRVQTAIRLGGNHSVAQETIATTTTTEGTMNQAHLLNHLVRSEPGIRVERIDPDFDHLAWFTMGKLLGNPHVIADDERAVCIFRFLMRRMPSNLTAYVSPWSLVAATEPDHEFFTAARSEQRAWHTRLQSIFFGSARTQKFFGLRGTKKATIDPALRQLEYHGVLIVSGKHIFPDRWPRPTEHQERLSLVSHRFGRLIVLADLPHLRHRCRCECGNMKDVDRNHLRSGRTKSCGCLAQAQKATIEARRNQRGR